MLQEINLTSKVHRFHNSSLPQLIETYVFIYCIFLNTIKFSTPPCCPVAKIVLPRSVNSAITVPWVGDVGNSKMRMEQKFHYDFNVSRPRGVVPMTGHLSSFYMSFRKARERERVRSCLATMVGLCCESVFNFSAINFSACWR